MLQDRRAGAALEASQLLDVCAVPDLSDPRTPQVKPEAELNFAPLNLFNRSIKS